MAEDFCQMVWKARFFGPRASHHRCQGIVRSVREFQDVPGFLLQEGPIDVGLEMYGLGDAETGGGLQIIVHAEGAIERRDLLEPGVVKQVEVPEVLMCVNHRYHGRRASFWGWFSRGGRLLP